MTNRVISEKVKGLVVQATPWNPNVTWWVVATEGAIALLLGIYVLAQTQQAAMRLIQIVGSYFFVTALLAVYRLAAGKGDPAIEPGRWLRTGISLVVGLIALFHPMMPTISTPAAATVLAIGLLLAGAIGIYGVVSTRVQLGMRWDRLMAHGLYVLFAVLLLLNSFTGIGATALQILGWTALLGGVGLAAYAIMLYFEIGSVATPAEFTALNVAGQGIVPAENELIVPDEGSTPSTTEPQDATLDGSHYNGATRPTGG
jgi:uncharacterized membrane protein HdeD (DUF308 family)